MWTGEERNPAADYVPELDRRDLIRLFYGDDAPADSAVERRAIQEVRRMLREHFEAPGFVVLEERTRAAPGGREFEAVRILQPRPE